MRPEISNREKWQAGACTAMAIVCFHYGFSMEAFLFAFLVLISVV